MLQWKDQPGNWKREMVCPGESYLQLHPHQNDVLLELLKVNYTGGELFQDRGKGGTGRKGVAEWWVTGQTWPGRQVKTEQTQPPYPGPDPGNPTQESLVLCPFKRFGAAVFVTLRQGNLQLFPWPCRIQRLLFWQSCSPGH